MKGIGSMKRLVMAMSALLGKCDNVVSRRNRAYIKNRL